MIVSQWHLLKPLVNLILIYVNFKVTLSFYNWHKVHLYIYTYCIFISTCRINWFFDEHLRFKLLVQNQNTTWAMSVESAYFQSLVISRRMYLVQQYILCFIILVPLISGNKNDSESEATSSSDVESLFSSQMYDDRAPQWHGRPCAM